MSKVLEQGFVLKGETTPVGRLLSEAWRARSLVRALARRDFYVRYRRPTFGVIWSIGVPVIQAAVLSIVFSRVVRIHTTIPFLLFMISGIVPWTFFSMTLGTAVKAITTGSSIASKVYFPRSVLPLSNVGTNFYGYIPSFFILIVIALAVRQTPTVYWLLLIPASVLMVALTSAFSLVLAALQVYFRDIAFIFAAILQAWFYGSAVFFPVTMAPKGILRDVVIANPATGMVELFRAAFMGIHDYTLPAVAWSLAWTVVLLAGATLLYRRYDRVFVDLL